MTSVDPTASASPFSANLPKFQVVWDSTSLGWLKECPALYAYQMLGQWEPRTKGLHLAFGGFYASGVEFYAKAIATGLDHNAATRAMVRHVLEISGTRDEDGTWHPWTPDPLHPDAKLKNRYTLVRTLVWNVEDRLGAPYRTVIKSNGKAAVEESFNFYAFDVGDEAIHLAGHLDEVCEHTGAKELFVKDDKTTKAALNAQYWKRYSPDNQVSLYTIAGKIILDRPVSGVLIRAAQIQVEGSRFATQQIARNKQFLDEWLDDTRYWIGQAQSFAINGYWPHNDKACGNWGGCAFREVCNRPPSHRLSWLREDFVKREWNPLQARGE